MQFLKNRIKEASTWAGISAAFAAGALIYHWMMIVSVVCGSIAVMTPDYTPPGK